MVCGLGLFVILVVVSLLSFLQGTCRVDLNGTSITILATADFETSPGQGPSAWDAGSFGLPDALSSFKEKTLTQGSCFIDVTTSLWSAANQSLTHKIFQLSKPQEKFWTAPSANVVRIGVDGSVKHHHQAACRGVLRNARGEWLMGFHKALGLHSVLEAEIYAIMIGLRVGQQMGLRNIVLYSDSLDVVNTLMRDCSRDHPLRDIIGEARDLLFSDWNMELHHTSRENILWADFMAKKGHDASVDAGVILVPEIPRGCVDMVIKDQSSCPH